jgi:hypothetical protein
MYQKVIRTLARCVGVCGGVGGCGCGCVWEYCTVLYDCFRIGRVAGGVVAHAATTTTNVHRMIISQYGVVSMIIIAWSHAAGNLGPHSAKRPKKGESGSSKAPGHITAQHGSNIGSNTAVQIQLHVISSSTAFNCALVHSFVNILHCTRPLTHSLIGSKSVQTTGPWDTTVMSLTCMVHACMHTHDHHLLPPSITHSLTHSLIICTFPPSSVGT